MAAMCVGTNPATDSNSNALRGKDHAIEIGRGWRRERLPIAPTTPTADDDTTIPHSDQVIFTDNRQVIQIGITLPQGDK